MHTLYTQYTLIVLSDEPLTNRLSCKCRHLTVPEWPARVRAAHAVFVRRFHTYKYTCSMHVHKHTTLVHICSSTKVDIQCYSVHTFIVLSHDPLTILVSSNWIHEIPAEMFKRHIHYNDDDYYYCKIHVYMTEAMRHRAKILLKPYYES